MVLEKEKTKKILESFDACEFNELCEDTFQDDVINWVSFKNENFSYYNGISKGVIDFEEADFVIKIPFNGAMIREELFDEEEQLYYETEDTYFSCFQFADDGETGDDYCKVEMRRYERATLKYPNIKPLFAENIFIGYAQEVQPIYIQEKCIPFCDLRKKEYSEDTITTVHKSCAKKKVNCFNTSWLSDVLICYGEDALNNLLSFIKEENIYDLHSGNLGYRNGKPIIFDYADFND